MCNIDGRVLEIPQQINDDTRMAYLYNFRVNSSILRKQHRFWIYKHLIIPALSIPQIKKTYPGGPDPRGPVVYPGSPLPYKPQPPSPYVPTVFAGNTMIITADLGTSDVDRLVAPDRWQIWLYGTTSRPGSRDYNLALSRRRAAAVAQYIKTAMGTAPVYYHIDPYWYGEYFAELLGKKERREDPLDRAVLIAFRSVYPDIGIVSGPPAPVNRPIYPSPCCAVKAYIEYLKIVKDAWVYTGIPHAGTKASGSPRLDDTGDYPDVLSVPQVHPDRTWMTTRLRSGGYSAKRAEEMYQTGPYTSVDLVGKQISHSGQQGPGVSLDATNVLYKINEDLANAEKELKNCTQTDPLEICKGDHFKFRKW